MKLKEKWTEVPGGVGTSYWWSVAQGMYECSSLGRIRNKVTGHILSMSPKVTIRGWRGRFNVSRHTIVWQSWTKSINYGEKVYKIDGNPYNCALYNLANDRRLKELGLR